MKPEYIVWNQAVEAAIAEYKNGIGAIRALIIREPVTLEHNPVNTDVVVVNEKDG